MEIRNYSETTRLDIEENLFTDNANKPSHCKTSLLFRGIQDQEFFIDFQEDDMWFASTEWQRELPKLTYFIS